MVTTSPDNLVTPDAGSNYALTADLALLASRAQAMGNSLRNEMPMATVANAAARDLRYPTPVQGNRVWRSDIGAEDVYLAAYNATTNPGGATPAGWYSLTEAARLTKSGSQNTGAAGADTPITWSADTLSSGMWASGSPTRLTIRRGGLYVVKANVRYDNIVSGEYAITRLRLNGGTPIVASENLAAGGLPGGGYTLASDTFRLAPGDYIEVTAQTSTGGRVITVASSSVTIQRIGA